MLKLSIVDREKQRKSFRAQQFVQQRLRVVNFLQRFGDRGRIDRDRARLLVRKNAIEDQGLNVPVENDPDELVVLVYDRASAVAANDVGVGNEIEWRVRI